MKKLTQISLLMAGLMVVFAGCEAAKDAASNMADKAGEMAGDAAGKAGEMAGGMADKAGDMAGGSGDKLGDMAGIDFGGFDVAGMKEKFSGVTDGFKDVSADNVDGLTSKISDLGGSIDGMGIGDLSGPAKTAAGGMISAFSGAVETAMSGISDEGILSKLKPAVAGLMEKLQAFQ